MFVNVYTLSIVFSISFLAVVMELVRRKKLQERYSLLWILMSLILLVLSISPVYMEILAKWLDIKNPPSLLFLFGLVYLLIYNLHITTVVSRQTERITRLTQEIAMVKQEAKRNNKEIKCQAVQQQ